jgi:hypothetical protein
MSESCIEKLRANLHISASSLKTFLMCPWKFRLHYVEGAVPEFRPSGLVLGKAVHEAIAVHHRALKDGKLLPVGELSGRLDSALDQESRHTVPIDFKDGEDFDVLRMVGRSLVELYHQEAKPQKILAVEQAFQAHLVDPRTGELVEPKLVGVFDLVEADEEGTVSVVEVKTAARRWSAGQVDLDLQGSLYAEAIAQGGLVPEGQEALIEYRILVKNKKPVLDRQYAVRRLGDREIARMIAVDALKAIEAGSFFRNPGWQCDGCPFRKRCGI